MTRALLLAVLVAFTIGPGCVHSVFERPVAISTQASAARNLTRIQPIAVEKCDLLFFIVPVMHEPADAYEELLELAEEAGGTEVVDFQHAYTSLFQVAPFFARVCWEARGTAAKAA